MRLWDKSKNQCPCAIHTRSKLPVPVPVFTQQWPAQSTLCISPTGIGSYKIIHFINGGLVKGQSPNEKLQFQCCQSLVMCTCFLCVHVKVPLLLFTMNRGLPYDNMFSSYPEITSSSLPLSSNFVLSFSIQAVNIWMILYCASQNTAVV